MTDLETYQNSPEGRTYQAMYALENSIDDLREMLIKHPAQLHSYRDRLTAQALNIGCLVNALVLKEAAE